MMREMSMEDHSDLSLHLLSLQYYLPRPMSLLPMSQTSHMRQYSSKAREDTGHERCLIQKQWGLTGNCQKVCPPHI